MAERGVAVGAVAVLAGGRGSRIGQPKATLDFEGEPLLARTLGRLCGAFPRVAVVAAQDQPLPELDAGIELLLDREPDLGPLGGLREALEHFAGALGAGEYVFVVGTDMPFIVPELAIALAEAWAADRSSEEMPLAIAPESGDHVHPLAALYAPRALDAVRELLNSGCRRMTTAIERLGALRVPTSELARHSLLAARDPELACLANVNTPADLDQALGAARGARR